MSNIEEDKERLMKSLNYELDKIMTRGRKVETATEILNLRQPITYMFLNLLAEREQDKKRIKELEEINTANRKVIVEQCDYIQNKSIPVQKVNDEIERYEYMLAETIHGEIQKYTPGKILLKIDTLKELLEDK